MDKQKANYRTGLKVREEFERTMAALFRVPKDAVKKPEKKAPKKNAGKD
jgi:hypothetical protein